MTAINVAEMPVTEKPRQAYSSWDSPTTTTDAINVSSSWHEQALQQAENDLILGVAHFVDWNYAKEQLRGRTKFTW